MCQIIVKHIYIYTKNIFDKCIPLIVYKVKSKNTMFEFVFFDILTTIVLGMPPQPNVPNKERQCENESLNSLGFIDWTMDEDTSDNSDNENEAGQYAGYQLLQQEENGDSVEDKSDEDSNEQQQDVFNKGTEIVSTDSSATEDVQINIDYNVKNNFVFQNVSETRVRQGI